MMDLIRREETRIIFLFPMKKRGYLCNRIFTYTEGKSCYGFFFRVWSMPCKSIEISFCDFSLVFYTCLCMLYHCSYFSERQEFGKLYMKDSIR